MASVTMNASPHFVLTTPHDQTPRVSASTMNSWLPVPDTLQAIISLLTGTTTPHSKLHAQLYEQLKLRSAAPDFCNYLAHILAGYNNPDLPRTSVESTRQAAGLLLKTNLRIVFSALAPSVVHYVCTTLIRAIPDPSLPVRMTVASCISELASAAHDLSVTDPLVPTLLNLLDSQSSSSSSPTPNELDGALLVLVRLTEDVPHLLDHHPSNPLQRLVPVLIRLTTNHPNPIRARTLQILNHLVLVMPPALVANVDHFCASISAIADDPSSQVRKRVCTSICLLLDALPEALAPHVNGLIDYMLACSTHPDPLVAREACEFWPLFANSSANQHALRPALPRLIPVLLDNIVYPKEEVEIMDASNHPDDIIPDRPDDIRPRFHQPRFKETFASSGPANGALSSPIEALPARSPPTGNGNLAESVQTQAHPVRGSKLDDGYDSDDEDDDDNSTDSDFKDESEWNVRKCSATALDVLSNVFKDELVEILLPKLQELLTNTERWELRECGVLALGAVADGCYDGILRHMRSVFPYLLHCASDQHYMVRSITCWTLSRYTKWVISERDDTLFQQLLKVFLDRMLDRNKVVQKASCSALAEFEEESGVLLSSYLPHITRSLTVAFERYQQSNLYVLYDVVCTLADAVGSELANPEHMNVLMPLLISRWNSLADHDTAMLPLLECLASVFRALGPQSQQFADNIFIRCASIMDVVYAAHVKGEQRDDSQIAFLTCCLDLMCALAEALGSSIDPFVSHKPLSAGTAGSSSSNSKSAPPLLPLLFASMKDESQEVRQSAFAFLGELARARIPSLVSALAEYIHCAVEALNPEYMSVSNNATWALGELVIMAGFLPPSVPVNREAIQHTLLESAIEPLIRVVNKPQLNKSLLENSALTLGRIGLVIPEKLAPKLGLFAEAVFSALRNIRDDVEKEQAFHGMNAMVKLNPTVIFGCFVYYVDAIASWFHCKPELEMEFSAILRGYKTTMGDQWFTLFNSFPVGLQSLLKERFGL